MAYLFLLILFVSSPVIAMEHYSSPLQDQSGRAISGATVTIYVAGTATVATIYSDNGVTAQANPFTTTIDGVVSFYAANGVYDIVYKKSGWLFDDTRTKRIALYDVNDGGGGGGGASISTGTTVPATCTPGTGPNALFLDTDSQTFYVCTAVDTLTALEGGLQGLDANFDLSGGNIITGTSEAKPLKIMDSGGTNGVAIYWHSAGRQVIRCIVANVEGDCNIGVPLNAGKSWSITSSDGASTYLQVDQATGKVGRMTVDAEDANVSITLYQKICGGDLVGVDPATGAAGHIWNQSPLDTAPTAVAITGTNRTFGTARHPDSDGNYGVQLTCHLPIGFTGNLDARAWWTTAGTGSAVLQIATKCYADNVADNAAFNTATPYTLPAGTASRPQFQILGNIEKTGCAGDQLMRVRVFRNRTHASDTLASGTFDLEKLELWGRSTY